ncbi:MAG: hypothetical protein HC828_20290 [Blastochloris sp.]|nr:hypothetical protein [Blastochloris sp.]
MSTPPTLANMHLARTDTHPQRQAQVVGAFIVGHFIERHALLHGKPTGCGAQHGALQGRRLGGRPQRDNAIARELDNIAVVVDDNIDKLAEIIVQQRRKVFHTLRATPGQAFRQAGKPRYIGHQHRRRKAFLLRRAERLRVGGHRAHYPMRHIAGERFEQAGCRTRHSASLVSNSTPRTRQTSSASYPAAVGICMLTYVCVSG